MNSFQIVTRNCGCGGATFSSPWCGAGCEWSGGIRARRAGVILSKSDAERLTGQRYKRGSYGKGRGWSTARAAVSIARSAGVITPYRDSRNSRGGQGARPCGPIFSTGIGWNPSWNAGDSGLRRKSSCAASTKSGSATTEWVSKPAACHLAKLPAGVRLGLSRLQIGAHEPVEVGVAFGEHAGLIARRREQVRFGTGEDDDIPHEPVRLHEFVAGLKPHLVLVSIDEDVVLKDVVLSAVDAAAPSLLRATMFPYTVVPLLKSSR
jgi:hypothetical protein